jgi:death on curing protein
MTEWISLAEALAIHDAQLAEHGGLAGVRDMTVLESALAPPQQLQAYGVPEPDLARSAAALAFGIARNHAFVDGNKRTSLVATQTFLILNGGDLQDTQAEKVEIWTDIGAGKMDEEAIAQWIRKHLEKK